MKKRAPLQPCLLLSIFSLLTFTFACGLGNFNPSPGYIKAEITSTQNPLVAQYLMLTKLGCPGQVMVEFGTDTSYGRTTAWYSAPAEVHSTTILVAGMKASTTYHMRVQAQAQCATGTNTYTGSDSTFTTGPLPALPFPSLSVTRPNPSLSSLENPGIEMIDVTTPNSPAFFTDRDANLIWFYDVGKGNFAFPFKLLSNGHILMAISGPWVLREVDLAGNTIRELSITNLGQKMQAAGFDFTPAFYTHDLFPLPNGHVIVLTNFTKNFTNLPGYPGTTAVLGDALVDLDENWNPVWAWNSFDYLDVNRHLNGLPDWTHGNAVIYSPADGNLLLSLRHQSWVLKIDYNNGAGAGDVLWKLGYQGDFALTLNGVPTDDPSQWFSFQHFPSIVSQTGTQTTLAVWDNGDDRVLDTSGTVCGAVPPFIPCYSRATIFNLDESAKVADLSWDNLPGDFSQWGGSINQLPNGNVEFDVNDPLSSPIPNLASEVQEVTPTSPSQMVWKLDFSSASQGLYAYRAYRVPSLYPGVTWQY